MATGYGGITPKYQIPYITLGDVISSSSERAAAEIIENQLRGIIYAHSGGNGVLSTGIFEATFATGASFVDLKAPDADTPAVDGFIDQIYIRSFTTMRWSGIPDNTVAYLYVQVTETDTESSRVRGDVVVDWNDTGIIPPGAIVVAKVTTTTLDITVDENPPERTNIETIASHAAESVNPHGTTLQQDQMIVSGIDVRGDAKMQGVTVQGNLFVSGAVEFVDGLEVFGDTRFNSGVTALGLSYFFGDTVFSGSAEITGLALFREIIATSGITSLGDLIVHGNVNMASGALVDGRDISEDGFNFDSHVMDVTGNPHAVTIQQISGVSIFGGVESTLLADLPFEPGVKVDGVDPSSLTFLLDGGDADPVYAGPILIRTGHTHCFSGIAFNYINAAPEYTGVVVSGTGYGFLDLRRIDNKNLYRWRADPAGYMSSGASQAIGIWSEFGVPGDCSWFSGIEIAIQTPDTTSGAHVNVRLYDSDSTEVPLVDNLFLQSTTLEKKKIGIQDVQAGVFRRGDFATLQIDLFSHSGIDVFVGDWAIKYRTVWPAVESGSGF